MNRRPAARIRRLAAIQRGIVTVTLFAVLLLMVPQLAMAQGVAMVTDVSGTVSEGREREGVVFLCFPGSICAYNHIGVGVVR
jgi:hypothetical protein